MKTQIEIEALAAELTEADLAALLWAKSSKTIKRKLINSLSLTLHPGRSGEPDYHFTAHCGGECAVCQSTIEKAEAELHRCLPETAEEEAAKLRAKATALIAQADALATA